MLDIIRKRASSIVTRVIFAVIVLVFIFFFGYNQIFTPNQGPQAVLARVDGYDVRQLEFQLAYDNNYAQYKELFKGEIPESMLGILKENTLRQLINQRLMVIEAGKLGLRVSDEEMLKTIESNPQFQKEGKFDRELYRTGFLPAFERKYNINYEDLLRDALMAQKLQEMVVSSVKVSPQEAKDAYILSKSLFTFEIAGETVGPITLAERGKLLKTATEEVYQKIFSLKPQDAPIQLENLTVRLIKRDVPTDAQWQQDETTFTTEFRRQKQQEYTQLWLANLSAKASIVTYTDEG